MGLISRVSSRTYRMEATLTDIPDKILPKSHPVYWRKTAKSTQSNDTPSGQDKNSEKKDRAKRIAFKYFPLSKDLTGYSLQKFIGDVVGGTTVCALRIPQGMAYGTLAGVSAINGLYTELVGPISYAILGSSPQL